MLEYSRKKLHSRELAQTNIGIYILLGIEHPQIVSGGQRGGEQAHDQSGKDKANQEPGEYSKRSLDEKSKNVRIAFPTLYYKIATYREKYINFNIGVPNKRGRFGQAKQCIRMAE